MESVSAFCRHSRLWSWRHSVWTVVIVGREMQRLDRDCAWHFISSTFSIVGGGLKETAMEDHSNGSKELAILTAAEQKLTPVHRGR